MFSKIKKYVANKFADPKILNENKELNEANEELSKMVLEHGKKAAAMEYAVMSSYEKFSNTLAYLQQVVGSVLLREDTQEITISHDMLVAAANLPNIQIVPNPENNTITIKFDVNSFILEEENENR